MWLTVPHTHLLFISLLTSIQFFEKKNSLKRNAQPNWQVRSRKLIKIKFFNSGHLGNSLNYRRIITRSSNEYLSLLFEQNESNLHLWPSFDVVVESFLHANFVGTVEKCNKDLQSVISRDFFFKSPIFHLKNCNHCILTRFSEN